MPRQLSFIHHETRRYWPVFVKRSKEAWVWWKLPVPSARKSTFLDVIEEVPESVCWHTADETRKLLGMMSALNREKVEKAMHSMRRAVGGIYKRTRQDENGKRTQRAEIRFDDVAGCLRTPVGGSSRQSIMIVEGNKVRSRLLSPREAARLMGLPDSTSCRRTIMRPITFQGNGVVVPVVRFLSTHILEALVSTEKVGKKAAA